MLSCSWDFVDLISEYLILGASFGLVRVPRHSLISKPKPVTCTLVFPTTELSVYLCFADFPVSIQCCLFHLKGLITLKLEKRKDTMSLFEFSLIKLLLVHGVGFTNRSFLFCWNPFHLHLVLNLKFADKYLNDPRSHDCPFQFRFAFPAFFSAQAQELTLNKDELANT